VRRLSVSATKGRNAAYYQIAMGNFVIIVAIVSTYRYHTCECNQLSDDLITFSKQYKGDLLYHFLLFRKSGKLLLDSE